ncbi:hypothetical protein GM3709_1329 [Geminocystis sp. NIES-3709]|nr:hypothetical protein GM3709_1329 [Geminocystis sp. NIES-3709]
MTIMGIIGALAGPRLLFNDSSATSDGTTQIKGILQQTRGRAISTTSAIRLIPDSTNPESKFTIEIANTRGCESFTKLREAATSTDTELKVYSTSGFVEGDRIKVGSDSTSNEILAIDKTNSIIKLGVALGSAQNLDKTVELADNWRADGSFQADDLTLPEKAIFTSNIPDWTLCFNSRGVAYIYDKEGDSQPNLTLSISSTIDGGGETLTVLKGGAIQTN